VSAMTESPAAADPALDRFMADVQRMAEERGMAGLVVVGFSGVHARSDCYAPAGSGSAPVVAALHDACEAILAGLARASAAARGRLQ
jgi:hypothetical protein